MPIEDLLQQMKSEQDGTLALSNSAQQSYKVNPDQHAGAVKLSQKSGLPVHVFPEMDEEAKLRVLVDQMHNLPPATAAFLADPENAKLAHDDTDNASKVEGLFGYLQLAKQAVKNALPTAGKGINETLYLATKLTGGQALARALGNDNAGQIWLDNMAWYDRVIESNNKIKPASYGQELAKMTFDTVAANSVTLPLGVAGKVPLLAGFAATAPGQLDDYLKAGYSPEKAAFLSLSNKSMEALTEMIGAQALYKGGRPAGKKIAEFMLGDLFGEEINNAYSALTDKATLRPDMTLEDFKKSVIDTAIVTAAAGGVQGAMMHPVAKLSEEYQRNEQSRLNKNFMLALGEVSGESKLRQRLPEKFRELVSRIKETGDVENVYIPGDQWKQYWQEKGQDPAKVADDIVTGGSGQYVEALASGGDIVIPIEAYADKLAPTEHHAPLLEHSRLHPGDATAFEVSQFDEEAMIEEIKGQMGEGTEKPSYMKVYDDIFGQLQGIGYDRQTAEQYATLAAVRAQRRAEVMGKDAFDLYNESPLKIVRPLPEGVQRQSVDLGIDPLIDRLRAGDIPSDENVFGKSLLQFVRERGIKDDRGDLKSMDVDAARHPGKKSILRADGMSLDKVREAAVEAGYLGEGSTTADLLDAIDQELRGTPKYSNQVVDPKAQESKLALEELKQHLDQVGLDYNQLSNEQIRRELYQMQGGELFQIVYHGTTPENLAQIKSDNKINGPVYFTPRKDIAEQYGGDDGVALKLNVTEEQIKIDLDLPGGLLLSATEASEYLKNDWTLQDYIENGYSLGTESDILLFQSSGVKRGFFRTSPDMTAREIGLLKDADLSTFIHELGHSWLEEFKMDANSAQAPAALQNDWAVVAKWLGNDDGNLTVEQHEQFARGIESYLMEGKAPSPELQPIFQRVKMWLTTIYRSLTGLNVKLNDEVRGVFDRLLASEEEIKQARQAQRMVELFATAEDAGMTEAEFAAYRKQAEQAHVDEVSKLERKLIKEKQREQAQWWKTARESMRSEVEAEAHAAPVYRAIRLLSTGKMFDGSEGPAMKLDKTALVQMYGEPFLKRLPRGFGYIYTNEGGMHPDEVASLFEFESGDAMIRAMVEAPPVKSWIEAETDLRMRETHGNMVLDGTVADEARAAIHGDLRSGVLAAELRAIRRQQRVVKPAVDATAKEADRQVKANSEYERRWFEAEKNLAVAMERGAKEEEIRKLKEEVRQAKEADQKGKRDLNASIPSRETFQMAAAQIIGAKPVGELAPRAYLEAERRAGKKAFDAVKAKDWAAAGEAKQQQLLNYYLYREASKAQEQIDDVMKSFDALKRSDDKLSKTRDMDMVNAARAILARYGIDKNGLDSTEYLSMIQQYNPDAYQDLSAAVDAATQRPRNWKLLSMDEFMSMNDAVMNLWEMSLRSKQVEIDGRLLSRDDAIAELNARMEDLGLPENKAGKTKALTRWDRFNASLVGIRAAATRVEAWVDAMDGGNPNGVFRRYIWNPVIDGINRYRVEKQKYVAKYLDLVKGVESSITGDKIDAPELGYTFEGKHELLGALLHTGNESNMEKLLVGRGWGFLAEDGGLDTSDWDRFTSRMISEGKLTQADYDFIQGVWDLMDEIKPLAQKSHRDMYGYYFSEITAQPVNTPFGTYSGGYAPAISDSDLNQDQSSRQEREALESTNNSFMFPSTGRGFTKSRVKYNKPLVIDLRLVPSHIDKALRFSFIEPRVKDVGRIVVNPAFRDVLNQFNPAAGGDMLVPWLQRAARQSVDTPSTGTAGRAADAIFRTLRRNTGMQMMVANVSNTIQQFTGLALSATKVQPRYLKSSLWRFVQGPAAMSQEISAMSQFMASNINRSAFDMQEQAEGVLLNPNAYEKIKDASTKHGYLLQQITQHTVDVVTWAGAYDQAVAEGANERDAIRQADSAVRMTQGTFNAEDLSRMETGGPFVRAFTQFYSYFNMQANLIGSQLVGSYRENGGVSGAMPTALRVYGCFAVAAIVSELIAMGARGGPDPDDDGLDVALQLLVFSQLRTAAAFVPYGGTFSNAAINFSNSKSYDDRMSTSPAWTMMEAILRTGFKYPAQMIRGEDINDRMAVKDVLNTIGMVTGTPAGALGRPLGYLAGMDEGKYEPSGVVDLVRGLITGAKSKN